MNFAVTHPRTSLTASQPEAPVAIATAQSHAGEILQGAVLESDGIHRILYSLEAPFFYSRAEIILTPGQPLSIKPEWKRKTFLAVQLLLKHLRMAPPAICIRLTTNIPLEKGCGSSTADIHAALKALLAHLDIALSEEELAQIIVEAEEASDGSILSRPVIFRHREGLVHEYLPGLTPSVRVLVVDAQPSETVPTVTMPRARYSEFQLQRFRALIGRLRRAFLDCNSYDLGAVATASARINQEFLPKPHFEEVIALVEREGGFGVAAAHSGTVLSILLPSEADPECRKRVRLSVELLGMKVLAEFTLGCCPTAKAVA